MARPAALAALPDPPNDTRRNIAPPTTVGELQAAVEGAPVGDRLEFMGQTYRVAPSVGALPYFRFAWVAKSGLTMADMEGVAVAFEMLQDCFIVEYPCDECETCLGKGDDPPNPDACTNQDPGDWPKFQRAATRRKVTSEDLMDVIIQAVALIAARPTRRPSDSSDGPSTTSPNSMGSSPSPDTATGVVTEKVYTVDDLIKHAEQG